MHKYLLLTRASLGSMFVMVPVEMVVRTKAPCTSPGTAGMSLMNSASPEHCATASILGKGSLSGNKDLSVSNSCLPEDRGRSK